MLQLVNKIISNIQLDLLDKKRQHLLQSLIHYTADFVLSGGTALALQLTHRKSFDFDFFSTNPIPKKLLEKLSPTIKVKKIVIDNLDELTFFTSDDIKVTFLHYPFKPNSSPIKALNGLLINPVREIALQKAYTIGRRGEYRDYFDLYTILNGGHISLAELISEAKQVYNSLFDEKLFLEQLVYFGDISNFEVIPVDETTLPQPNRIKEYFEDSVKKYLS